MNQTRNEMSSYCFASHTAPRGPAHSSRAGPACGHGRIRGARRRRRSDAARGRCARGSTRIRRGTCGGHVRGARAGARRLSRTSPRLVLRPAAQVPRVRRGAAPAQRAHAPRIRACMHALHPSYLHAAAPLSLAQTAPVRRMPLSAAAGRTDTGGFAASCQRSTLVASFASGPALGSARSPSHVIEELQGGVKVGNKSKAGAQLCGNNLIREPTSS
jgi:hypothetical protein